MSALSTPRYRGSGSLDLVEAVYLVCRARPALTGEEAVSAPETGASAAVGPPFSGYPNAGPQPGTFRGPG
jgi:hypothetical protein